MNWRAPCCPEMHRDDSRPTPALLAARIDRSPTFLRYHLMLHPAPPIAMVAHPIDERMARKMHYMRGGDPHPQGGPRTQDWVAANHLHRPEQRRRLAVKGKKLTPGERRTCRHIVKPGTILAWFGAFDREQIRWLQESKDGSATQARRDPRYRDPHGDRKLRLGLHQDPRRPPQRTQNRDQHHDLVQHSPGGGHRSRTRAPQVAHMELGLDIHFGIAPMPAPTPIPDPFVGCCLGPRIR